MAQITLRDYLQEAEDAISSKRVDDALASCQYILAYFPESLEAQRLLGEVYLAQGKLEDAQQAFDWVLTNDPENVVAYCSRALVSEHSSDYDTALDCYQQAYELSRGNSQIRQAFNQLSEKAGQPGFMLSRAGLARLYMRGDLLFQAVQEWDIVLAMTPDRLDARTGLLEVYWRLGMYDRASQLAEQILQDVPRCVKALLLLAYVIAPQDMLRSQELVKKAEVVDPDLVMAQDLFADQMASRQGDPFLKLLHKSPVTLGVKGQVTQAPASQNADPFASLNSLDGTVSADALASWGSNASWDNDTTLVKPRSEPVPPLESGSSVFPSWMTEGLTSSSKSGVPAESNSIPTNSQWGGEAWDSASLSQSISLPEDNTAQVEPWDSLQDALNNISPEVARQISDPGSPASPDLAWLGSANLASSIPSFDSGSNGTQNIEESFDAPFSYEAEQKSNDGSSTPTWLSMLNQKESQASIPQPVSSPVEPISFGSGDAPVIKPQPEVSQPLQPSIPPTSPPLQSQPQTASYEVSGQARMPQPEVEADDGDEELFFGPNWLKTLGAASLDGTAVSEEETPSSPEQTAHLEQKPTSVSSWDRQEEQSPGETDAEHPQQYLTAEEPQTSQDDDAWAHWKPASSYASLTDQESYQPWPDLKNQPQDNQSFWSLPQQGNLAATNQEQPSWMSQLSQSSQDNSASAYADWASLPSDSRKNHSPESHMPAGSEPNGQQSQSMPAHVSDTDLWNAHSEQVNPPSAQLSQQAQTQSIDNNWLAQLAGPQTPVEPAKTEPYHEADSGSSSVQQKSSHEQEKIEQNLITTLEELEQKLLSGGFTPLEPNTLASIAQSHQEEGLAEPAVIEPSVTMPDEKVESSFSSSLTERGNFDRPGANPIEPSKSEPLSVPEPTKLSSLGTIPAPLVAAQSTPSEKTGEDATVRASSLPASPLAKQSTRPMLGSGFVPTSPTPAPVPAIRINGLLDSELETTMKRPAVRLEPMQQQTASRDHGGNSHSGRVRTGERSGQRQSESKGNVSYRDRLVIGYQAQLIGDFDEAMQEYRLIIRNAPDLLGEVVSNVRALLKLAPNYSAGYRVLGDAYMRQGEYLQAMESYNKALTMAKKAKG